LVFTKREHAGDQKDFYRRLKNQTCEHEDNSIAAKKNRPTGGKIGKTPDAIGNTGNRRELIHNGADASIEMKQTPAKSKRSQDGAEVPTKDGVGKRHAGERRR